MNLQLEETWLHQQRILCYTVYSLNNNILKDWSDRIYENLSNWPTPESPLILFDVSNPNVSMSYFVLTRRNIFNLALMPEAQIRLDAFISENPELRVRLALVLSKTMIGVMTSGRSTNILRRLTSGKVFFEREPAITWLLADTPYSPDAHTRHMDVESALNDLEMDTLKANMYHNSGELRMLVNGSLEIIPISDQHPVIIGRSPGADIDVTSHGQPAITVSRQHAQISLVQGELTIMDLNSKNGTFIADERLSAGKPIRIGSNDDIRVGAIQVRILS